MSRISIILVNYNSGPLLAECVRSILAAITEDFEIIVVDNASSDCSLSMVENDCRDARVRTIRNQSNVGFAAANNIGAAVATGEVLHFLNPDTQLTREMNMAYRDALHARRPCIFVTPLKEPSGAAVKSRHYLPLLANYAKVLLPIQAAANWYTGASVLMSREVFEAVGQWPTDYFMYAEDLDLFYRAALLKIPVLVLNATVIHTGSGCTRTVWDHQDRVFRRQLATKRFYRKYGRLFEYYCIAILLALRDLVCTPSQLMPYVRAAWRVERQKG